MPVPSELARKAAAPPTSRASSASGSGELALQYPIISPMKPMALAARDASGPALMQLTRWPYLRPASNARTRVSLSSAAFAELIPQPYPGSTRSLAMYERERIEPPLRLFGEERATIETIE